MKTFEIGKIYSMRSACDHECVWLYRVAKRTPKTLTLETADEDGLRPENRTKAKTCRVAIFSDFDAGWVEGVRPLGRYSMSPLLLATAEVKA